MCSVDENDSGGLHIEPVDENDSLQTMDALRGLFLSQFCTHYPFINDSQHSVGFGDICPGNTDVVGKVFLLVFSFASLGFFCGPVVQLGAAWRHAIPGGLPVLGSFVLTLGVTVFTMAEGLDQFEAIYASVITGT